MIKQIREMPARARSCISAATTSLVIAFPSTHRATGNAPEGIRGSSAAPSFSKLPHSGSSVTSNRQNRVSRFLYSSSASAKFFPSSSPRRET
jgi:hypothetical protein